MFAYIARFITASAISIIAYWLYVIVAVPLIEPKVVAQTNVREVPSSLITSSNAQRDELLSTLFSAESWQRNRPRVLETPHGMLLFKQYQQVEGGRLEIKPCTLIYHKGAAGSQEAGDEKQSQRTFVIDAPNGAVVAFDEELDLARGKVGQFVSGRLIGDVRIFSPRSKRNEGPNAEDDSIDISASNVQLTPKQIWSPDKVNFRFGMHKASGRDMAMRFRLGDKPSSNAKKIDVQGIKSFELVHVDYFRFENQKGVDLGAFGDSSTRPKRSGYRIDVQCGGAFNFDFDTRIASFEDGVRVSQPNPDQTVDTLTCRWLGVYFDNTTSAAVRLEQSANASRSEIAAAQSLSGKRRFPTGRFAIQKLVAFGQPVILDSPSERSHVEGNELQVSVPEQSLLIKGAGFLQHQDDSPDAKRMEVAWKDHLHIRQVQSQHVASVMGGTRVLVQDTGDFHAREIHLWMKKKSNSDRQESGKVALDKILAQHQVQVNSPQLQGATERLEVWFTQAESTPNAAGQSPGNSLLNEQPKLDNRNPNEKAKNPYAFFAKTTRIQIAQDRDKMRVSDVTLDGDAWLRQAGRLPVTNSNTGGRANQIPNEFEVRGSVLQISSLDGADPKLRLQGQPATVRSPEFNFAGQNVQLQQYSNQAWVQGPGTLQVSVDKPKIHPAAKDSMNLSWQGGMFFDGQRIQVQKNIVVGMSQWLNPQTVTKSNVRSNELLVTLSRPIRFRKQKKQDKVTWQQLDFRDAVYFENESLRQGQRISKDTAQLQMLSLNNQTGDIRGTGPGKMESIHYSKSNPFRMGNSGASQSRNPKHETLSFGVVQFEREATGNLHRRELVFTGHAKALYGPVQNWQQKLTIHPRLQLQEDQYLLSADRLWFVDAGGGKTEKPAIEMQALGNASVEGAPFIAQGSRISYVREKDLLILEGTGHANAQVWSRGSASPDAVAKRILYRHRDKYIEINDLQRAERNLQQASR